MGARTIHVHYGVHWLLELTDKELMEHVTHPDGVEAARKELRSEEHTSELQSRE